MHSRIGWKYLLCLELSDPGLDNSVLSEFRSRLLAGKADYLLFDHLLTWCRQRDLLAGGTDPPKTSLTMLLSPKKGSFAPARAILKRLGQMRWSDGIGAGQIGDRAGQLKHPVVATGR